jgi:hypothetical protein
MPSVLVFCLLAASAISNFLIAGRDTTASGLTYMFKALSDHPDIENKVCDELHRVIGEHGEVDETNIKSLKYLEAVFMCGTTQPTGARARIAVLVACSLTRISARRCLLLTVQGDHSTVRAGCR